MSLEAIPKIDMPDWFHPHPSPRLCRESRFLIGTSSPSATLRADIKGEAPRDTGPGGAGDIQSDAELVGVQRQKKAAALRVRPIVGVGAVAPGGIADVGRLGLDDLGAKIGQQPCAIGCRDVVAQLEDPEIL